MKKSELCLRWTSTHTTHASSARRHILGESSIVQQQPEQTLTRVSLCADRAWGAAMLPRCAPNTAPIIWNSNGSGFCQFSDCFRKNIFDLFSFHFSRFCCSVAVFFCFGTTHFCNKCHDDHQRCTSTPKEQLPPCPVRGRSIGLSNIDGICRPGRS